MKCQFENASSCIFQLLWKISKYAKAGQVYFYGGHFEDWFSIILHRALAELETNPKILNGKET